MCKYVVFLVRIFLYSIRIQENSDQKKIPHLDTFQVVTIADDLGLYVCQSIALPISLKNMNFTPHWCYVTYSTF